MVSLLQQQQQTHNYLREICNFLSLDNIIRRSAAQIMQVKCEQFS